MFNFINFKEAKPKKTRISVNLALDYIEDLEKLANEKDLTLHGFLVSLLYSYVEHHRQIGQL